MIVATVATVATVETVAIVAVGIPETKVEGTVATGRSGVHGEMTIVVVERATTATETIGRNVEDGATLVAKAVAKAVAPRTCNVTIAITLVIALVIVQSRERTLAKA